MSTSLGAFASQLCDVVAGRRPPILKVGNLSARRDFVDVDDIADAVCRLAEKGKAGELYNVCSGRSVGIREVLDRMDRVTEQFRNLSRTLITRRRVSYN